MTFQDAVTTVLTKKYADFSGRARRSEYWFWALAVILAEIVLEIIGSIIHTQFLYYIFALAVLVPGWAVFARRMHDTGRSGWWWLIALTIIGAFFLLYWLVSDSEPGTNQYGPSPKGEPNFYQEPNPTWGQG